MENLIRPYGAINGRFWKGDRYGLSERDHKDGYGNDRRRRIDEDLFLCQVQVQETQGLLICWKQKLRAGRVAAVPALFGLFISSFLTTAS
jgi:hypothetical protein